MFKTTIMVQNLGLDPHLLFMIDNEKVKSEKRSHLVLILLI